MKRLWKYSIPILIFVIIMLSFIPLYILNNQDGAPRSKDGVLDLRGWDFSEGELRLSGTWEFYWNQLLTSDDFKQNNNIDQQLVVVPKTWNAYKIDGKSLPGFGYATYRLRVIADNPDKALSLRIDTMSTAYRLFIDDREIASNGIVGTNSTTSVPNYKPLVADFLPPDEEFDIIVQVSNYVYARGGFWYDMNLGTHDQIDTINTMIIYKDAVLIGSLLIMAMYYASFYFVLKGDKSSKYVALLSLLFIFRTSIYGDFFLCRLFPAIPFGIVIFLTYASLYWITIVIYLLVDSLFQYRRKINFQKIFIVYGIVATILTAILPISLYTAFISGIEIIGTVMVVMAVLIVMKAYSRKEKGSGVILLAVLGILLTGIHDIHFQANIIRDKYGELTSIGIFVLMFVFSLILASRFSDAYSRSRQLSEQLSEALEKERIAAEELLYSELAFLKAQIKPHFIYNALSVIDAFVTVEPHKAKELLYSLTDYLRGSFHFENINGLTPLTEELETVKAYVHIEKARFQDKLYVEYDIDESISLSIPILTIQPLVENAIRHGILKKPNGGTVILRIFIETPFIVIEVKDDGVGIDSETLRTMFAKGDMTKGVGLSNINRRLHLIYGRGLEIRSELGLGTTVTIRIIGKTGTHE